MSQIPMDLDQTMWEIAERRDAQAAAEFSERFPALASDMQTRMNLVVGMKNARQAITPAFVPGFTPKYMSKPKPKWLRYGPAALTLAALASASFYVTQNLLTPLPDPSIFSHAPAPSTGDNNNIYLPPAPTVVPGPDADAPKPYTGDRSAQTEASPAAPVRIKMSQVHLVNAIQAIGHRFHSTVSVPKGFPNPIIDVDLTGADAMTFINQLANQNNFTAYYEGDNKILVVPAKDDKTSDSDSGE